MLAAINRYPVLIGSCTSTVTDHSTVHSIEIANYLSSEKFYNSHNYKICYYKDSKKCHRTVPKPESMQIEILSLRFNLLQVSACPLKVSLIQFFHQFKKIRKPFHKYKSYIYVRCQNRGLEKRNHFLLKRNHNEYAYGRIKKYIMGNKNRHDQRHFIGFYKCGNHVTVTFRDQCLS